MNFGRITPGSEILRKIDPLNEGSFEEGSAKDGGAIFQAILSHDLKWKIVDGDTVFDQTLIKTRLHRVDVFPDLNYVEADAMSTYFILSEVNILKRKFDLATESIKKMISPEYASEIKGNHSKRREISMKYFDGTQFDVNLVTDHIVLREVSSSGIDSGSPSVALKLSTGMVDQLDGKEINSWNSIYAKVTGNGVSIDITNSGDDPISKIVEFDEVDSQWEVVFQKIIPSLYLRFKGDPVKIETYSNRSAGISWKSPIDIENIFSKGSETGK